MTSSPSTDAALPLAAALALCALGGVLYFVGFVGFDQFYLIWICFVPALIAIEGARIRRVVLLGAVFGLVTNMGGYYWVVHLIATFADLAMPLAILGYLLLCLYQGFLLAVVLIIVRLADTRLSIAPVWSLPVAFVAMETGYPLLFPSYIGNSQYLVPAITQIVELTGMLGLTALIGLVNGAVYEVISARRTKRPVDRRRALVPVAAMALALIYGAVRLPMVDAAAEAAPKLKVAMVQTNLGAKDKAEKGREFRKRHVEMSKAAVAEHPDLDLVVGSHARRRTSPSRSCVA